jgi:autotransporter-associated beta strand protein
MVRFRCYTPGPAASATFTGGKFIVTGDNSAYKGKITIHQNKVMAEFANETALGGPADAFAADRLILSSNGTFYCNSTYTLSDPTRGIAFLPPDNPANFTYGGGTFQVTEGNTLTIQNVISGDGSLRKTGEGTLVLDAVNTISGVIQLKEGKLVARNAQALGTGQIKLFAPGTLRIETVDGVTLAPALPFITDEVSVLNVELSAFDAPVAGKIEANIFTLPNAESFDVSSVNVVAPNLGGNYKIEVQTKETAAGLVVFATATPKGLTILFR